MLFTAIALFCMDRSTQEYFSIQNIFVFTYVFILTVIQIFFQRVLFLLCELKP